MAKRLSSSKCMLSQVCVAAAVGDHASLCWFVPSMARQSAQRHAAPAYRTVVLVWLLSGVVKGFLVGAPPRTVLPSKHGGATTYTTPVVVPRTSCSAVVPASSGADQLAPEEASVLWPTWHIAVSRQLGANFHFGKGRVYI